jgi:hypothetical protein
LLSLELSKDLRKARNDFRIQRGGSHETENVTWRISFNFWEKMGGFWSRRKLRGMGGSESIRTVDKTFCNPLKESATFWKRWWWVALCEDCTERKVSSDGLLILDGKSQSVLSPI